MSSRDKAVMHGDREDGGRHQDQVGFLEGTAQFSPVQPTIGDRMLGLSRGRQRLSPSGRYDMRRLKEAMLLRIANDGPLPPEYLDHELGGDWRGFRNGTAGYDTIRRV